MGVFHEKMVLGKNWGEVKLKGLHRNGLDGWY